MEFFKLINLVVRLATEGFEYESDINVFYTKQFEKRFIENKRNNLHNKIPSTIGHSVMNKEEGDKYFRSFYMKNELFLNETLFIHADTGQVIYIIKDKHE